MAIAAIISDIHGNLEALRAVLETIGQEGYHPVYCLGDIVGYGPDPQPCLDLIRARCSELVVGNHDEIVYTEKDPEWFNPLARQAILWTTEQVTTEGKNYLRSMRLRQVIECPSGNIILAHGNLLDFFQSYITNTFDAEANFEQLRPGEICFIGHTHRPLYFSNLDSEVRMHSYKEEWLDVAPGISFIMNVGSVGQPRDHDPRASFLAWDQENRRVRWHRVAYEYRQTQEKMLAADLPAFLVDRLAIGR